MRPIEASHVSASAASDGLRRCGGCGRDNAAERELCRICGSDLDTGLSVDQASAGRGTDGRHAVRYGPGWLGLLAAGLAVVVVVVVSLGLLGRGPFSAPERLAPALLLRAAYPGDPVALPVASVATTTTATLPDRVLSPLNLIDGDGVTAWIGLPEDADDAGEIIEFVLERPSWISRIQFRNGDQVSAGDYERSGRLQRAVLTVDGGREHRIDLLDIGRQAQVVELREPELTTRVTIRVERIFPGTGTRGVALSEVSLVGWPADAADAALARQRSQWP
jgi:hypothetical protein